MSFVTYEEFEVRYGGTVPAGDKDRIEALLADACALIEDLTDDTYEASGVPQTLVAIAVTAARRAYDNPSGLTSETIGSYSWSGGGGAGVYLTLAEQKMILKAVGRSRMVSATLQGVLPSTLTDEQYLTTNQGDPVLYFNQDDLP